MKKNTCKILIVEDDKNLREFLALRLQKEGFEVSQAGNGQEGLEKSLAEKPELILLDIQMPIMDGLTMIKKLRDENEYGKNVVVMFLTNFSAAEDIIKNVAETRPLEYIVKSIDLDEIVKKIENRLASIHA
jgi:DNA-binding response OmpR family regulator